MSRPGFVLEVDDKTPALLTMAGAGIRLERFGLGTKVIYPADAVASANPVDLIDAALDAPLGIEPLAGVLAPSTTLTIVVLEEPQLQPRMRFDVRRSIVERVLELAARAGVEDVQIVIANGLAKRWSVPEITRALGERVATSFLPDGLITSHDATADDLVEIGEVDGVSVRLNRRVAESDLVVSVGARASSRDGSAFATGLVDVATLRAVGAPGASRAVADQVAGVVETAVNRFAVEAVLGQPLPVPSLRFAAKREWEWRIGDQLAFAGARQLVAALPRQGTQQLYGQQIADYAVLDVIGGAAEQVVSQAREAWRVANAVEVKGQADVLVTSVWGATFDEGDPDGSPIGAANRALVQLAGCHDDKPLAREGASLIAFHPLAPRFSNRRQAAASDFFATVLPATTDPDEIRASFEDKACSDEWYLDLYRKDFSDHPLQTFQTWYRIAEAGKNLGQVIWVGGNRRTAALLGHRAASTYADALEIASDSVGSHPAITYLRGPGQVLGVVR
ncbi:lactate racemase domain-containing protein [Tessaracoccus caeni]|uniref:lactate racemase domain-containing protein n=1 Tax=Tessaracoccus caeni TaxID=3031239 RepID=UPI0023D9B5ED|nr:lactate racemase domain-containing protein [Tessaracoccus caeni]MDF1489405.1 lactate racemase domain-containing protein [Tessaracoccus caeni]